MKPCAECLEQTKKNRRDQPHPNLVLKESKSRRSMFGGWEDETYECKTCETIIEHSTDKMEAAPFWLLKEPKSD